MREYKVKKIGVGIRREKEKKKVIPRYCQYTREYRQDKELEIITFFK